MNTPSPLVMQASDPPCLCCCRPLSEHNAKRQCPEQSYFVPNERTHLPSPEAAGSASVGVTQASQALLDKLVLVEQATSGIWSEMHARGRPYQGPNWGNEADDLRAALRQDTPSSDGWEPIDSAPKDGRTFDVWVPFEPIGYRVTDLFFGVDGKLYRAGQYHPADLPNWPTHWMPKAAAPHVEGEG